MKVLIFSDIHGNLPAFEKLLKEELDIEEYINLGDVVNYGPWSNDCVEAVSQLKKCHNIIGNHERYFINKFCDVQNPLVQDFFNHCIKDFKYENVISEYSESLFFNDYRLIHTLGAKDYIFHDSIVDLKENTILGHSHQQFTNQINGYTLVNPGSVGQNRQFINVSNYAVWDVEKNIFTLKSLKFDLMILLDEMKYQNYPISCIEYYKNKKIAN